MLRQTSPVQAGPALAHTPQCSRRPEPGCSDGCFSGLTMFLSEKRSEAPLCTRAVTVEAASLVDTQVLASGIERASESTIVDPYKSPKLPTAQPMDELDSPQPAALRRVSSLSQRFEALMAFAESPRNACGQGDSHLVCDRGRPRVPRSFSLDMHDGDTQSFAPACAGQQSRQRASSLELRYAALAGAEKYAFAHNVVLAM